MTWLVILGSLTTLVGLAGLGVCIRRAAALRKAADPETAKARMHGLVALNMASVGVAGLGLAFVVVGLILAGTGYLADRARRRLAESLDEGDVR